MKFIIANAAINGIHTNTTKDRVSTSITAQDIIFLVAVDLIIVAAAVDRIHTKTT